MTGEEVTSKIRQAENRYDLLCHNMTCGYRGETPLYQKGDPADRQNGTPGCFFLKIGGVQYNMSGRLPEVYPVIRQLLSGMYAVSAPVSFVITGDTAGVSVYFGTNELHDRTLVGLLTGMISSVRVKKGDWYDYSELPGTDSLKAGGYVKGCPVPPEELTAPAIDSVIRGMRGKVWRLAVFAVPTDSAATRQRASDWMNLCTECSELSEPGIVQTTAGQQISYSVTNHKVKKFMETAEAYADYYRKALAEGEWLTTVQYAASDDTTARMLGGLLVAAFGSGKQIMEPVHLVESSVFDISRCAPAVNVSAEKFPLYATWYSSSDLAWFCCPPGRDTSGFSVSGFTPFDVSRTVGGNLCIGEIQEGRFPTGNDYLIDLSEFNRHCLVIGLTGSGKTNTVKSLVFHAQKAQPDLPFLIIEPAKREYYQLYDMGFENLEVYSIGCAPGRGYNYCLNPFERASRSVSIQTHIDMVFSAFKASFIMYTPMPYVLEKAIYAIYEDMGWDVAKDVNRYGEELYPTIEDLYFKLPVIIEQMGFDKRMKSDLTGSLQSRINTMRLGSKGQCLNVARSFPIKEILSGRVVLELEDIGDDDVKAFIMSMLLVQLSEYRRGTPEMQQGLCHLLVMEEAHRLLRNVASGTGENADPRGAAVEFFCNMLAEMRSKGQGFIIVDQIPSKLAPDLVKNTNLKILHRVVDSEDRWLMGGAMHMTKEQIDMVSALPQGTAAVYSEGDFRPKLVRPPYAGALHVSGKQRGGSTDRGDILRELAYFDVEECLTDKSLFCVHCPLLHKGKCVNGSAADKVISQMRDVVDRVNAEYTRPFTEKTANVRHYYPILTKAVGDKDKLFFFRNCILRHLMRDCWKFKGTSGQDLAISYLKYLCKKNL